MSWGRVVVLDSELGAEISELRIVELFPVIRHEGPRDLESAYYRTPTKLRTFCSVIVAKGSASAHLVK